MIDEAINLIKKQRDMYMIQNRNIEPKARSRDIENRVKAKLRQEVQLRDFIIKILEKHKKEDANEQRNK